MILACNAKKEHCVVRRMAIEMDVHGRTKRGMTKRRWLDRVRIDIKEKGLSGEDVYDRATWSRVSPSIDRT